MRHTGHSMLDPMLQNGTEETLPPRVCRWCSVVIPTGQSACLTCCTRCGTQHEPDTGVCGSCGSFLARNQAARTHGLNARTVPADLRMDADQLKDAIVADLGGLPELSALEVSFVRKIADVEVMLGLLLADMAQRGILTPAGRKVRDVYPAFLAGIDRWDRLAQRVGLKRRAKATEGIREWADRKLREQEQAT